jgi:hypothetical protein
MTDVLDNSEDTSCSTEEGSSISKAEEELNDKKDPADNAAKSQGLLIRPALVKVSTR